MSKNGKLSEMMNANPKAQIDSKKVESAIDVVRQRREAGFSPKGYDLTTPYGNRGWIKQSKSTNFKLT